MAILVVNCGSSSVKLTLFDGLKRILHAHFHDGVLEVDGHSVQVGEHAPISTLFDLLNLNQKNITAIGHRFVHGGDLYTSSTWVDPVTVSELEKLIPLAPLHNRYCLDGVKACIEYFGNVVPQLLVFDTAFHSQMPELANQYALSKKYGIKRYGFHGISHAFLWDTYSALSSRHTAKVITLHLGNGCSMSAIQDGVSVDTSMGFSPLEGLVMATRTGDIDAAVVGFLCEQEKKTPQEIIDIFNFESGLLGLSGISSSMEKLISLYDQDASARLAVDLFCYRSVKYIGAYIAVLGGIDALIFSGGIGENAPLIREKIIQKMAWFGITLDFAINSKAKGLQVGAVQEIHAPTSSVSVLVVATDENLAIAKELNNTFLKA